MISIESNRELVALLSSQMPGHLATKRVLCLSNGHGEDVIAVRILQALQEHPQAVELAALPLVGEGRAYHQLDIPLIGPTKTMPSGGFIYQDGRQFARDIRGGLLQLTWAQFQAIRQWAKQGGMILAVGDIFPLLLAHLSGARYAFVGTAKSEYYLRDEKGKLFPHLRLEAWSGSVYYPWERWMMSRERCHAVFPRDSLTTKILQRWDIPAFDLGNPMMDGLETTVPRSLFQPELLPTSVGSRSTIPGLLAVSTAATAESLLSRSPGRGLIGVLLPGSRVPEAYENWQLLLQAVNSLSQRFVDQPVLLLGAIASSLNLEPLTYALKSQGWQSHPYPPAANHYQLQHFPDSQAYWFTRQNLILGLSQRAYADCLHLADWAIAMAGTATEQFVGLGKPAVTIPGKGPQFTQAFAEAQTRLLGTSVILVENPAQVAIALEKVLHDPERLKQIADNGLQRMGEAGAASRIADCILKQLAD